MQLPEFRIYSLEKICFFMNYFLIKIDCSLIEFDVFFSDAIIGIYKFTEILNYLERNCQTYLKNIISDLKIGFYG